MDADGGEFTIGAALSLGGGNVRQARMAAAGLVQAVEDSRRAGGVTVGGRALVPRLALLDDGGTARGLRHSLDLLAGADLLMGPYGSGLTGEAGLWAAEQGRTVWNHGGSADEVESLPRLVSLASPTSRYLAAVVEAVAGADARAGPSGGRVVVGAGPGSFGRAATRGAVEAATAAGLGPIDVVAPNEVPDDVDADVLLLAGSFDDDVAVLRRLRRRPRVVAAVAGGLREFAGAVGARQADGILAPSQWEEGLRLQPDVGPRTVDVLRALRFRLAPGLAAGTAGAHVEYPAAQAYAAVVIALHCLARGGSFDDDALLATARSLHCTTFFGRFGLGPDGRQAGHALVVVQWRNGAKCVVAPPSLAERPPACPPPPWPRAGGCRAHADRGWPGGSVRPVSEASVVPEPLLEVARRVLPGAELDQARLSAGQFHDVVLLPGAAAIRVARRPAAAAELPRRMELLRRLAHVGLPFRVPEPLGEVVVVDGVAAVAVSWIEGVPAAKGAGDPAQLRLLLDAVAAVDLTALADVLGPPHTYCGGERWAEVIATEVVPRLPVHWRVEVQHRTEAALALPPVPPSLVHGDLAGDNIRHDERGAVVGVLDWDLAQPFDPAVDAACLSWYGWPTLRAAVDDETYRRARTWWRTFGYEQLGAAVLNGEPADVLDGYVARTVAWLEHTSDDI